MRRALTALILAPLLVSSIFGLAQSGGTTISLLTALIVLEVMLAVSLIFALPLLLLLKRIGRLEWWVALLAGGFCGMCFAVPLSYSPNIDRLVDPENVLYVRLGALTGFVFWWIGVFRNRAFPFVHRGFPIGVLLVLPLAVASACIQQSLEPVFYQGRVVAILVAPSASPRVGQASVRLTGGGVVRADLSNTWPSSMVLGQCVNLERRWSTLRARRIYEVDVPFGGGLDDCYPCYVEVHCPMTSPGDLRALQRRPLPAAPCRPAAKRSKWRLCQGWHGT